MAAVEGATTVTVPSDGLGAETTVSIDAGDHTIPGIFTVPKARGSKAEYPTVLMLHGFGADKNEGGNMFGRLAEYLGVAGYASLRIDFAGTGDSTQPWIENNLDGMVADATTALDWLGAHDSVDAARIGVHGWSMGGRVSATIAGTDDRIQTLSTWAGAIQDGTDGMVYFFSVPIRNCTSDPGRETLYQCAVANGSVLYDPFGTGPFELSQAWFETMMASQALALVGGFDGPQLAVHGELDDVVQPSVSQNAIAGSGSYDATLRIIPGGDHTFGVYNPADPGITAEEVLMITARWTEDKL
jgi:dipeptidyl aminopeptidase/acylaminoacyl peptidase